MERLETLLEWADDYLEYHATYWSESTLKSERSRLRSALRTLAPLGGWLPEPFYKKLKEQNKKPYTIKTIFIRMGELESWLIEEGLITTHNRSRFKEHSRRFLRRKFQQAYAPTRRALYLESEEMVQDKIRRIKSRDHRLLGHLILATGLRYTETKTICPTRCEIEGKGGTRRTLYLPKTWSPKEAAALGRRVNYTSFYRSLKRVGLTPHLLRKQAATRMLGKLSLAETLRVMGWTNLETASAYFLPRTEDKIKEALHDA